MVHGFLANSSNFLVCYTYSDELCQFYLKCFLYNSCFVLRWKRFTTWIGKIPNWTYCCHLCWYCHDYVTHFWNLFRCVFKSHWLIKLCFDWLKFQFENQSKKKLVKNFFSFLVSLLPPPVPVYFHCLTELLILIFILRLGLFWDLFKLLGVLVISQELVISVVSPLGNRVQKP